MQLIKTTTVAIGLDYVFKKLVKMHLSQTNSIMMPSVGPILLNAQCRTLVTVVCGGQIFALKCCLSCNASLLQLIRSAFGLIQLVKINPALQPLSRLTMIAMKSAIHIFLPAPLDLMELEAV